MKNERAFSLAAAVLLLASTSASAFEGRASDAAVTALSAQRSSSYAGAQSRTAKQVAKANAAGKQHAAAAPLQRSKQQPMRAAAAPLSHRSGYFYIYEADGELISDQDGDGFYREFRIRFDADATFGDARVYARLYLRRAGEIDWILYHETDDFWIEGQSDGDDYFVTTTLDEGFAAGEYDVLIDLYESGVNGIAATIGPAESGGLGLLPLEEAGLDAPIEVAGYAIRDITTTLLIDDDLDDHYSRFSIRFDPDADVDGRWAYARIWVRPQGGEWIEEHVTDDFLVDASGDLDAYTLTVDWFEGYPTALYDVQVDLYEADSGLFAAQAGSERPELSRIPLEDAARDVRPNPPVVGDGGGSTISRESGGGAFSWFAALGLMLLAAWRRREG